MYLAQVGQHDCIADQACDRPGIGDQPGLGDRPGLGDQSGLGDQPGLGDHISSNLENQIHEEVLILFAFFLPACSDRYYTLNRLFGLVGVNEMNPPQKKKKKKMSGRPTIR